MNNWDFHVIRESWEVMRDILWAWITSAGFVRRPFCPLVGSASVYVITT
jgi:hypothetical protein